jgi:hypothetical protein
VFLHFLQVVRGLAIVKIFPLISEKPFNPGPFQ